MRVGVAAVGRMRRSPEADLVGRYLDRARQSGKALGLTGFDLVEIDEARAAAAAVRKTQEAGRLARSIPEGGVAVALDEAGRDLASADLADRIARWRDASRPALVFLIGGPDGHATGLRDGADLVLSLGRLTLPHLLARAVLAEQLYRATTILAGHPYHRA